MILIMKMILFLSKYKGIVRSSGSVCKIILDL